MFACFVLRSATCASVGLLFIVVRTFHVSSTQTVTKENVVVHSFSCLLKTEISFIQSERMKHAGCEKQKLV